nr:hypothetical protein BaRGS_031231 [Batillaria attramentaria]
MPHVYMNRVLHDIVQVSGVDVAVPQPLEETPHTKGGPPALLQSDVRDDTAQQHVLHCLRKIADGALPGNQPEVMFVLSQMNFGDYLNSPCYSSAATCLPRPVDLSGQGLDRGDFDVLVIHRQYGLMVGEIKAVGASAAERGLSDQQLEDELLAKLKKMLNVPGSFMKKLGRQKRLDQMPDFATPSVFPSNVLSELDAWWRGRMSGEGPDPAMSDDVYLDLVARFAGPASIVRVHCPSQPRLLVSRMRTEGQAVSETHDRLTRLALYPSQVDVLQQGGQLVYLTGPPGTGKTLMLVLEGMEWLRQNRHVHIASLWYKSRAASFHIYQQLKKTARKLLGLWAARRVHIHLLDECDHDGLEMLENASRDKELWVIADEVQSPVIRHRDVIVLVVWGGPRSGSSLWEGRVIQSSSGVVAGLGHSGFPVRIIRLDDVDDIADMAAMRGRDEVIVTGVENVWGLERKVVVVLGDWDSLDSYDGRLYAMSRSTAQLITVVNHVDFSKSER